MGLQLFINLDDYNRVVESNVNRIPIRAVRLKAQSTTDIDFRFVRNGNIIPMEVGTVFRFAAKASGERDSDPVLEELNSSFTVFSSAEDWFVRMSLNTNTTAMMDLFNDDEDPTNDILLALLDAELLWEFGGRQNRTPDPFLFEMENPVIRAEDLPPIDNPAEYPDPTIILTTPDLGVTVAPLIGGLIPSEFIPAGANTPFVGATPTEDGLQGLVPAPLAGDQDTKYLKADGTWAVPPDTDTTYDPFTESEDGLVPAPVTASGKYLKDDGTWDTPPDTTYAPFTASEDGLVPAPITETGKFLKDDGTWADPAGQDYDPFTGATPSANGTEGLVPAPLIGDETKFLKGDGTWGDPAGETYDVFTLADDGLVPAPVSSSGRFLADDGTWQAVAGGPLSVFGVEADGLVPGPLAGDTATKYLKADGTWSVPPDTDTTYAPFTSSVDGLVPAPVTPTGKYLKDDATWGTPVIATPTLTEATTARTLSLGDAGSYIRFTSGSPTVLTVPTDAVVLFSVDTVIYFRRAGAGALSLSNAGVTINNSDIASVPVGGVFALKKIAANTWDFI